MINRKLAYKPSVRERIVQDDRIAVIMSTAQIGCGQSREKTLHCKCRNDRARGFIKDTNRRGSGIVGVRCLNVMIWAHVAVCVGRKDGPNSVSYVVKRQIGRRHGCRGHFAPGILLKSRKGILLEQGIGKESVILVG